MTIRFLLQYIAALPNRNIMHATYLILHFSRIIFFLKRKKQVKLILIPHFIESNRSFQPVIVIYKSLNICHTTQLNSLSYWMLVFISMTAFVFPHHLTQVSLAGRFFFLCLLMYICVCVCILDLNNPCSTYQT